MATDLCVISDRASASPALRALTAALLLSMALAGCNSDEPVPTPQGGPVAARPVEAPAPVPAAKAKLASVAEAAQVLDLSNFALLEGGQPPAQRSVAQLSYQAPGAMEAVFAAQRAALVAAGWAESDSNQSTAATGSGLFHKQGYTLSLTVMPGSEPNSSVLMLKNHGNLQFSELALPAGLQPLYQGGHMVIYSSEAAPDATTAALRAGLLADGWEAYGSAAPMFWMRKQAIRLAIIPTAAAEQGGRSTYTLQAELLSAEIPAPVHAAELSYDDGRQELSFSTAQTFDQLLAECRAQLAAAGWKTSLDAPTVTDGKQLMTFRSAGEDLLTLSYGGGREGATQAQLSLQSKAQLDAMNERLDRQAEAYKRQHQQ